MAKTKDVTISPRMRHLREAIILVLAGFSGLLLLSLCSYTASDSSWSFIGQDSENIVNWGGPVGAWFADILIYVFGVFAYVFPAYFVILVGRLLFAPKEAPLFSPAMFSIRLFSLILVLICGTGFAFLSIPPEWVSYQEGVGGIVGVISALKTIAYLNIVGTRLLFLVGFLVGVTFLTGFSWLKVMDVIGLVCLKIFRTFCYAIKFVIRAVLISFNFLFRFNDEGVSRDSIEKTVTKTTSDKSEPSEKKLGKRASKLSKTPSVVKKEPIITFDGNINETGVLPSVQLLDEIKHSKTPLVSNDYLKKMSRLIEEKLKDFSVTVKVEGAYPGPVITRFELNLAPGIKASKITGLSRDLARSLSVKSVRIVEVIAGKSFVGLEIPNEKREMVGLREIYTDSVFTENGDHLTMALGKDISGNPIVANLGKMPHLLVAGTTGSGKSVGVNAMILSFLYKSQPEDVRMIMIDPKMLELSIYEGIPHLLAPVVTDMKQAANALTWSVAEMERRYKLLAAMGVRNIAGFNKKVLDAEAKGEPIIDPLWKAGEGETIAEDAPHLDKLPYIVVIIDEFADMIMVVGKQVEELIARIAQKARAAGIHLILATQRPSVNVITGLIKANIPTRISFQVSSKIDSRTILDQMGAEQLLGQGDMLYLPPGTSMPERVHGAFVDDHEVHNVVNFWKSTGKPQYIEEVLMGAAVEGMEGFGGSDESSDELYDQAVRIVTESRKASISLIQRKLKIGYNRAARMVEEMEESGVVTAMQSNGQREVLAPPPNSGIS